MTDIKIQNGLYMGTSGLVLTEPNKLAYPAEFQNKSRLEYYASQFNSIEINSSFYKIPRGETYDKWAGLVPDYFRFTIKLWKGITHESQYSHADLEKFFFAINRIGSKKGCLLIQFPATSPLTESAFENLMRKIKRLNDGWRIAVEFRHNKWYSDPIFHILNENAATLVQHDMPRSIPPDWTSNAPFLYLRFHGEKGDFKGSYSERFLGSRAAFIQNSLKDGKEVYVYFNNTIGDAAVNLKQLNALLVPAV